MTTALSQDQKLYGIHAPVMTHKLNLQFMHSSQCIHIQTGPLSSTAITHAPVRLKFDSMLVRLQSDAKLDSMKQTQQSSPEAAVLAMMEMVPLSCQVAAITLPLVGSKRSSSIAPDRQLIRIPTPI